MWLKICYILFLMAMRIKSAASEIDMFQSARIGDIDLLMKYLASGMSVNSRDAKGNSAIIIAAGRGQVATIKLLLEHGANPEDITQSGLFEGKTALMWASSQGRAEAVALLLQAGADAERASGRGVFEGKTALMWASSQGRTSVVRLLLSTGLDVDFSSHIGNFKVQLIFFVAIYMCDR